MMLKITRQVLRVCNSKSCLRPYHMSARLHKGQKNFDLNNIFDYQQSLAERVSPTDLSDINELIDLKESELNIDQIKCAKFISRLAKQANIAVSKSLTPVTLEVSLLPEKPKSKLARIFDEKPLKNRRLASLSKEELFENEMEEVRSLVQNALDLECVGKMHFPIDEGYNELCERMHKVLKSEGKFVRNYLNYVMKISAKKNIKKKKLLEKEKIVPAEKKLPPMPTSTNGEENLLPSPAVSAAVRRINKQYMNKVYNYRLSRTEFSQPLIFDMRFNADVNPKISHLIKQMVLCYSINREEHDPMKMVLCNCKNRSPFLQSLKSFNDMDSNITMHENSYLELDDQFPREKLVYLSPDANHTMTEFSPHKIYIVGGVVDSCLRKNLTKSVAMTEGIVAEKLPLQKYLLWGGTQGRQSLSLDIVLKVLLRLRSTNSDWIEAFKAIPTRFHRGLTESAMEMVDYDEKTLAHYAAGHVRHELRESKHKHMSQNADLKTVLTSYLRQPEPKQKYSRMSDIKPTVTERSHHNANRDRSLDDFFNRHN